MYAIYFNNKIEIIELLIEKSSDLKISLFNSIIFNKKKIVSLLFKYFFVEFYNERCKLNLLHLHYLYNCMDDEIKLFDDFKDFRGYSCVFGWEAFFYKRWGLRKWNMEYLRIFIL